MPQNWDQYAEPQQPQHDPWAQYAEAQPQASSALPPVPPPPNPIPQGGGLGGAIATGENVASGAANFVQGLLPKPTPMPNITPQQIMAMNPEQRQQAAQQISNVQAKNAVG